MALKIYNSLSHKEEEFVPLNKNEVLFYSCGPTVYNYAHIGNYRAYIFADTLKRGLLYLGYNVKHIMNYTDVDDKIIRSCKEKGMSIKELTSPFVEAFMSDTASLNILPATKYTYATSYINEMVSIIERLLERGHAYKSDDGSVYFNVESYKEYGRLVKLDKGSLETNAKGRMKSDEYDKDSAQDFALWKAWDSEDGDIYWETALGNGRPGWHIECSAMAISELGETIDIHTGGVDNKFPHHENEIAQSECSTGKTFSKYFMHNEHILVDGKKMAKSLGNFYTLKDLRERGFSPLSFRYLLLTSHYRTQLNFSLETLQAADVAHTRLKKMLHGTTSSDSGQVLAEWNDKFLRTIENDLSTPESIALIWELMKSDESQDDKRATIFKWDEFLGLKLAVFEEDQIPEDVVSLAERRFTAKKSGNYADSDALRREIEEKGYKILDDKDGYKIEKA